MPEGLPHEIETGDTGRADRCARDGERMVTDHGKCLDVCPPLIDAQGCLNEDGANVHERMNAGMEEDRQLQQQLRTRNVCEALEKKEAQAERADESKKQKAMTRKPEVGKRDQDQGMGM